MCLAIACHRALAGERVIIANDSADLTFRDFKKASQIKDAVRVDMRLYLEESTQ